MSETMNWKITIDTRRGGYLESVSQVRAVVVEDAVSTGSSLLAALDVVLETGADVVATVTMVDRGDALAPVLAERGVPYHPVFTYRDLGIDPL